MIKVMGNSEQKKVSSAEGDDGERQAAAEAAPAGESAVPGIGAPKRTGGVFLISATIVALAVVGVAGYLTWPKWTPLVAAYLPAFNKEPLRDPRVDGMSERLNALEEQAKAVPNIDREIKEMEAERARFSGQLNSLIEQVDSLDQVLKSVKKLAEATTLSSETADADASLKQLSQRLARMEELPDRVIKPEQERLAAKDEQISNNVAEISRRIDVLETAKDNASTPAAGSRAIVSAISRLREALHGFGPYKESLEALKAAAGGEQDIMMVISVLEPLAADGIPTQAVLRDRFDAMAVKVAGSFMAVEGGGWAAKAVNRLASLVSVRRIGADVGESGTDAALADAEAGLKAGDLSAAVKALEGLVGQPVVVAEPWLKDARARLTAERATATLNVLAASLLSPAKE